MKKILGLLFIILCFNIYAFTVNELKSKIGDSNWDIYSIAESDRLLNEDNLNYYNLGLLFLAHHNYEVATDLFLKSPNKKSLFFLAYIKNRNAEFEKAQEYIKSYLKAFENISVYSLYIDILNNLSDMQALEELFLRVEQKGISSPALLYKKGVFLLANNQCDQAIIVFSGLIKEFPHFTIVNRLLSNAYKACNQKDLAEVYSQKDSSKKIVDNDPLMVELYEYGNPAFLLKNKLKRLINSRAYQEAIGLAKELVTLQPSNEDNWIDYGSLLVYNNKNAEAINAYKKAYNLNPHNSQALQNLVKINAKNSYEADKWNTLLLKLQPDLYQALVVKADYYLFNNEKKKAIKFYLKALKQNPENLMLLKHIPKLYIESDQPKKAIDLLTKAFDISKNNTKIASNLSRALMITSPVDKQQTQRALRIAKNINKYNPGFTEKFTLLMALRINKDKEAETVLSELEGILLSDTQLVIQQQLKYLSQYDSLSI